MNMIDLRLAFRGIGRRPVTSSAIVVALALALAVVTALFSILDGLLFRSLPFRDPTRLVAVDYQPIDGRLPALAYSPALADRRTELRRRLLASPLVAAAAQADPAVFFRRADAEAAGLRVQGVDARFFPLLGLSPILGASFRPTDERGMAERPPGVRDPLPVVIGYDLWQRAFGGDPKVVGVVRELGGRRIRVVGVMGRGVKFPGETNVWAPERVTTGWPPTYVRLTNDATLQQLAGLFPDLRFRPLREAVHPGRAGAVPMLLGAAALLLLVTGVQVASLLFSGALDRLRDIGVHLSLGAGRLQVLRPFAIQAGIFVGAALGLALLTVRPLTAFLIRMLPEDLSRGQYLMPDLRTLAFGGAMAFAGVVLLVATAAVAIGRARPLDLIMGHATGRALRATRVRQAILIVQMTLTALLLYVAGLGVRSYARAVAFDYGFDAEHVLVFTPPRPSRPRVQAEDLAQRREFKRKIQVSVERLPQTPDVVAATNMFSGPLGLANQPGPVHITVPVGVTADQLLARVNAVGPDYVRTLGATMVAGRSFDDPEYADRDDVVLVNETLARVISPPVKVMGEDVSLAVIGRKITTTEGVGEVIGIVRDAVDTRLDVPSDPQVYTLDRRALAAACVLIRTSTPLDAALPDIQAALEPIWGRLPATAFGPLAKELDPVLMPYRGQSILLGLIASCCLPIAAVGLMGALMHFVRLRTREIAIRMALGAEPKAVRRSVTRGALTTVAAGTAIGAALGTAGARLVAHQLFQVRPLDLSTVVGVTAVLMVLGWLAATLPARRASSIQPAEALRQV